MTIKYKKGFKYQLEFDVSRQLDWPLDVYPQYMGRFLALSHTGLLELAAGYAWDGPSGPTLDQIFPRLYNTFMAGSAFHDAGYQFMRLGVIDKSLRIHADKMLWQICIEDGMIPFRAWYVYHSVRKFAGSAALEINARKVITAP